MQRNPNTVGQVYRIPDRDSANCLAKEARLRVGDLLLCLEHSGDCHYQWARLDWETRTQATDNSLPVRAIKNYYNVGCIFGGYALSDEWVILQEPLSTAMMLGALIAMHDSGRTGLLLPLFPDERAAYLEERERIRADMLSPPAVAEDDEWNDREPKLKAYPTCKTCKREMMDGADNCGGDCSTCVGKAEAGT